jgi:hypothetical protein
MHAEPETMPFLHRHQRGRANRFAVLLQLRVPGQGGAKPVAVLQFLEKMGFEKLDVPQRELRER